MDRDDLGFLLAKATQRWNELLQERFRAAGWGEVRPSYGSILVPLFEEDGLRMGELARRARLSKQTMTTMVRLLERDGVRAPRALTPTTGARFASSSPPRPAGSSPSQSRHWPSSPPSPGSGLANGGSLLSRTD